MHHIIVLIIMKIYCMSLFFCQEFLTLRVFVLHHFGVFCVLCRSRCKLIFVIQCSSAFLNSRRYYVQIHQTDLNN